MLVDKDPKLFLSLREFYGEERGEFVYNLILRSIFKIIKVPHSFLFPEGKEFVTTTSDYLPKDDIDEDIEVIEEEILAKTDDKSYTILNKVPVAYSIYKLEKTYPCDPVLSNDTQDVYLIGDKVEVRTKSFPVSNVFKYCNVEKEFSEVRWSTKKNIIQFMNGCSLEEQFHTLVGDSKTLTKLQKNIKVPSNTIVTRWSKYLILPYTLRKLLIKNKKLCSYRFLKEYLDYGEPARRLLLQLGEEALDFSIKFLTSARIKDLIRSVTKDNIKEIRNILYKYGQEINKYSYYNVFLGYSNYIELRRTLHKKTPVYPKTVAELRELTDKLHEEKRLLERQEPFKNQREELKWDGDDKMFVTVPHCGADLIKEGKSLHHCVGSYVNQVRENYTNIVFIRSKKNPEKSFYTVELKNNYELVQIRGLQNRAPTKEVQKFLDKYLAQLPPKK